MNFTYIQQSHFFNIIQAILLILLGYVIAIYSGRMLVKFSKHKTSKHFQMLFEKIIFYVILSLFVASAIQHLGFRIGTLLGAAGILTAAIGFASQTSMSNVISGLFIIGEKPFEIGDTIKINDIQGEVQSIDLLSIKIKTPENTMVRVPNETLIKTSISNLSYFTTRRVDLIIQISYGDDIENIKKLLLKIAESNLLCLKEPAPMVIIQNFSENRINLQLSCWANRVDYTILKNTLQEDIQISFNKNKIAFPSQQPLIVKLIKEGST